MRIILVGHPNQRARWRNKLLDVGFEVVDEISTLGEARVSETRHDALLLVSEPEDPAWTESEHDVIDLSALPEQLTARELEVLDLLAMGITNKAIATRLTISDQTVKFHVASILGKLGASNRTEAVRRALRKGLIAV